MNSLELLSKLEARNVELAVPDGRLRYRPATAIPEELREELRAQRGELVEMLVARPGITLKGSMTGGVSEIQSSLLAADILAMPFEEFARAGLAVGVRSEVLGEVVLLASDKAVLDPGERRPVYRAAELRELLGLSPCDLRQVHRVKVIFGGTVEAS